MNYPSFVVGLALLLLASVSGQSQSLVSLIPAGSIWKYFDMGYQPSGWETAEFDDGDWAAGPAQLGYGDGDESTVVSFGPNANDKYITTYFRHAFNVVDPADYSSMVVRLLRDDGGVVYLNGVEVFRSNMPGGPIGYFHYAASTIPNSDESVFFTANVEPGLLVSGRNVMAAEIHQANPNSSDLSFDLNLVATLAEGPPVIQIQPRPRMAAPGGSVTFAVRATGAPPLSYQWDFNGSVLPEATNATLRLDNVMGANEGIYRATVTNPIGIVASAKVGLTLVNLTGDFFQIYTLSTNQSRAIEHANVTGDDRGGIAASFEDLLVTGDESTARFSLQDLTGGSRLNVFHDALASDLRTGTIYALADGTTPLVAPGGRVSHLIVTRPVPYCLQVLDGSGSVSSLNGL